MTNDPSALLGQLDVSRETIDRLKTYVELLKRWNSSINLVSASTLTDVWTRHILDSAQVLEHSPRTATTWADLGSGGGFPGAVVAILANELRPNLLVTLVEADQRKAAFLRAVARETDVAMGVVAKRIEDLAPLSADVVSARALAPLPELLAHAKRHLAQDGIALLSKGANAQQEIDAARDVWRFDCDILPSKTDPEAVILKIGGIERV